MATFCLVTRKKYAKATTKATCRDFGITGKKMDEIIEEQVREFILRLWTDEYNLDLSVQYKPTLSVEDLLSVLYYHWCLDMSAVPHEWYTVQLPLLMLMTAYTSSRPGALIESGCVRGSNDALQYRDVVLRVIPNLEDPERHVLVIERIDSPDDIFRIDVPPCCNSLQWRWRSEKLNIPVFHHTYHTAHRVRTSPDCALPYDAFNQYLQPLIPYCIRRATANAVDDVVLAAERNQVLGHSQTDIFERSYLLQKGK
ncbi:hypothetical protein FQN53_006101 [Emmonsiellopsis sp. PD_33]|nr:hypothetical protein FQN53_006101 [Emmonsiellopsis sp. PD_33]